MNLLAAPFPNETNAGGIRKGEGILEEKFEVIPKKLLRETAKKFLQGSQKKLPLSESLRKFMM